MFNLVASHRVQWSCWLPELCSEELPDMQGREGDEIPPSSQLILESDPVKW